MSSSSSKRKQDEKNVKLLRELAALPVNKQCFDCHQRGPTYVNMTIGSFVCTKCSGILRGLNPPHRVKSISMAAFTPDEIDFVKNRGNEYCKKVWLGLYDGDTRTFDNFNSDEQQMKDFLVLKYERKRWYVNPAEIARQASLLSSSQSSAQQRSPGQNSINAHNGTSTGGSRTPASLIDAGSPLGSPAQNSFPPVGKPSSGVPKGRSLDLFDNDPFSSPVIPNKPQPVPAPRAVNKQQSGAGSFANFANFDSFGSSPPLSSGQSQSGFSNSPAGARLMPPPGSDSSGFMVPKSATVPSGLTTKQGSVPPNALQSNSDKYSALAELDGLFSSGPTSAPANTAAPSGLNSSWTAGTATSAFGGTGTSVFGSSPGTTDAFNSSFGRNTHIPKSGSAIPGTANTFGVTGNPFMSSQSGGQAQPPAAFGATWGQQVPATAPASAGPNPFFAGSGQQQQHMGGSFQQHQQPIGQSNPFGGLTPTPISANQGTFGGHAPQGMMQTGAPSTGGGMWGQQTQMGGAGVPPAWQQNPFMGNQQLPAMSQQQQGANWNPFL